MSLYSKNQKKSEKTGYQGILLYSGGLDSYIAYHYLNKKKGIRVLPVYFCLGNSYEWFEKAHILRIKEFKVEINATLSLGDLERKDNFYIPMKNPLLMILGAIRYHPHVYIGSLFDDRSPDGNEETFSEVSNLLNRIQNEAGIKEKYKRYNQKLCMARILNFR